MSWQEYHKSYIVPVLFGNQAEIYKGVLEGLKNKGRNVLGSDSRKTIVLGGFHGVGSVEGFNDLCDELGGHQRRVLLDLHQRPFKDLDIDINPNRVQADLSNPPFAGNSVDLMFLDYTLDFMSDEAVREFGRNMDLSLTEDGLVLAAVHDRGDRVSRVYEFFERVQSPVRLYRRTYGDLINLALPLKPVSKVKFPANYRFATQATLVAFAKN